MSDPREIIDNSPMTIMQWVVVVITVLMNAMDGFDVLAISVAGPGIKGEFAIDQAALGFVLAMELLGMALGSVFLGGVADKIGRRKMSLSCLAVMSVGMFLVSTTSSLTTLCVWRFITGLGIGGMLSTVNAIVAEFSNSKARSFCISMMVIGYPLGGIACGAYGQSVLEAGAVNWRVMFTGGAILSAVLIPLVYFLVPESIHWLTRKQPLKALDNINAALRKMGHKVVSELPKLAATHKHSVLEIFSPGLARTTIITTVAYFFTIVSFYFVLKWTPTIVTEMGFAPSSASGVLTWANIGGAAGGAVFGLLTVRIGLKPLTIVILALTTVGIALFGRSAPDLTQLGYWVAFAGFFGNAGISGLYTIVARVFPTHLRATGTGFVIGVGRGGAYISPIIAGFLFDWNYTRETVALIMGSGAFLAGVTLLFLKLREGDAAEIPISAEEEDEMGTPV